MLHYVLGFLDDVSFLDAQSFGELDSQLMRVLQSRVKISAEVQRYWHYQS